MIADRQLLLADAAATGFRPEMLEKAVRLLGVLDGIRHHPYLRERVVLKGGTALNLFLFRLPRLSVDIDLNYVGARDQETMREERPKVDQALSEDPAVVANALICLLSQANYLLDQQIAALESQFVNDGGYSERLAAARMQHRSQQNDARKGPVCPLCGKPMALRTARAKARTQGRSSGAAQATPVAGEPENWTNWTDLISFPSPPLGKPPRRAVLRGPPTAVVGPLYSLRSDAEQFYPAQPGRPPPCWPYSDRSAIEGSTRAIIQAGQRLAPRAETATRSPTTR